MRLTGFPAGQCASLKVNCTIKLAREIERNIELY